MPRTIFFDVDGVLIHGYHAKPDLRHRWDARLLEDLGVDPERFQHAFIRDVFMKKVIVGETPLLSALERVLPGLGYKGSPMAFVQYWLRSDSRLNEELVSGIRQLKQKADCRLFIATNQEHMRAFWLWHQLGLHEFFEDIYYSARLGLRKPDLAFFKAVNGLTGPFEEPPLFFDDTPAVVENALKSGWEAVLFETVEDFTSHPWIAARLHI